MPDYNYFVIITHELRQYCQQVSARFAWSQCALQEGTMGCTSSSLRLCALQNTHLWLPGHHVLLGALCSIPARSVLHALWPAGSWLGHIRSHSSPEYRGFVGNRVLQFLALSRSRRPTSAAIHNRVHAVEEYHADPSGELVFHPLVHIPDPRVLAIPIYIFRMAHRTRSAQTLPPHAQVRLLT